MSTVPSLDWVMLDLAVLQEVGFWWPLHAARLQMHLASRHDKRVTIVMLILWEVTTHAWAAQEAVKAEAQKGVKAHDVLAKAASSALVFQALKKGSLDNITVVVMLLRWD